MMEVEKGEEDEIWQLKENSRVGMQTTMNGWMVVSPMNYFN